MLSWLKPRKVVSGCDINIFPVVIPENVKTMLLSFDGVSGYSPKYG
jgi:hypothetical protein